MLPILQSLVVEPSGRILFALLAEPFEARTGRQAVQRLTCKHEEQEADQQYASQS